MNPALQNSYSGSCLCGAVRFEIRGQFESFYLCHCDYCRKDTGSAHAANLFSETAQLNWLSGQSSITSFTLEGTRHSKSFCSRCGAPVPQLQMDGTLLVVPAGSLDSKLSIRPDAHLFTASRADWDTELQAVPMFKTLPG